MPTSRRMGLIERTESGRYVLLLVISFAVAVIATRGFLELTGYPQIGSSVLHIAHLLWGGLALIIALLATLIFANRWVMVAGALLGGVGVGLFIDEVGKFITVDNDYFFPWAAPIIYAVMLVLVLVVLLANRARPRTPRADLYHALDQLTELLDHDLEASERARIEEALRRALEHSDDPAYHLLASALLDVIRSPDLHHAPDRPGLDERIRQVWLAIEARWLPEPVHRLLLVGLLAAFTVAGLLDFFAMLALINDPQALVNVAADLGVAVTALEGASLSTLGLVRLALIVALGILVAASAVLIFIGRVQTGTALALLALLVQLTVVTLLTFYVSQFAAVAGALAQLGLLLLVLRYRTRFLRDDLNALAAA